MTHRTSMSSLPLPQKKDKMSLLPTQRTLSIRFPPIRPEQDVVSSFSALTDYLHKLQDKYDLLVRGRQVSYDRRSLLAKMEHLRNKTYVLIGLLQHIQLALAIYSYRIQVPDNVPIHIKNKISPLLQYIQTLDRQAYKGFFKSMLRKVDALQQQTIELNNNIQHSIDRLQPIRSPRMLIQRTTTVPAQSNQLLPPPTLRRSYNM